MHKTKVFDAVWNAGYGIIFALNSTNEAESVAVSRRAVDSFRPKHARKNEINGQYFHDILHSVLFFCIVAL